MKKPASRGDTGLSKAFRQVSFETYAPSEQSRQAPYIARRYGLTPALASVVAELAFPAVDNWRNA